MPGPEQIKVTGRPHSLDLGQVTLRLVRSCTAPSGVAQRFVMTGCVKIQTGKCFFPHSQQRQLYHVGFTKRKRKSFRRIHKSPAVNRIDLKLCGRGTEPISTGPENRVSTPTFDTIRIDILHGVIYAYIFQYHTALANRRVAIVKRGKHIENSV